MARFKRAYPGLPRIHHGPSPAAVPAAQPYQRKPPIGRRQVRCRAHIGPRTQNSGGQHGLANATILPPGTGSPPPAISITIGKQSRTRAWTGHCQVGGGMQGPQPAAPPPLQPGPFLLVQQPPVMSRRPVRRWTGHGIPSQTPNLLPAPQVVAVRHPQITRSRLPSRAVTGPAGAPAAGVAVQPVMARITGTITTVDPHGVVTVWDITGTSTQAGGNAVWNITGTSVAQ